MVEIPSCDQTSEVRTVERNPIREDLRWNDVVTLTNDIADVPSPHFQTFRTGLMQVLAAKPDSASGEEPIDPQSREALERYRTNFINEKGL